MTQKTHFFSRSTVLAAPTERVSTQLRSQPKLEVTPNGTKIARGLRVFKEGTFKDSMGRQNTWTAAHLDQMVGNFRLLEAMGTLVDVPVRTDHSGSVHSVIGYITNIYRDPTNPAFLAADVEFTEPSAAEKYERGTYRSRSIELGTYETNDGAEYYPTVMGLAFVDIPAVEGLHSKLSPTSYFSHVVYDQEEETVTPEQWAAAANYAKALEDWATAANYAKACDDWSKSATYAQWVTDATYAQVVKDNEQHDHGRPAPKFAFRLQGHTDPVTDPVAVQAYIHDLEAAQAAQIAEFRKNYVESLANDNKIAVTQKESLIELTKEMTPAQFSAFKASYDVAESLPMFQQFVTSGQQAPINPPGQTATVFGAPTPGATPPGQPQTFTREQTLRDQIAYHRSSGLSEDAVKELPSYKELEGLLKATGQNPTI